MSDKIKIVHLEQTKTRIDDGTKIVRYMKLETLLLMLTDGFAFIPSHATLRKFDPLETRILFDLPARWQFWKKMAKKIEQHLDDFALANRNRGRHPEGFSVVIRGPKPEDVRADFHNYVDELASERCVW